MKIESHFSAAPSILFLGITVFVFGAIVQGLVVGLRGTRHPNYTSVLYSVIFAMLAWLGALFFLSTNGFFAEFDSLPPRIMLALAVPIATILLLTFNRSFGDLVDHLPAAVLIYLQAFRILVEIVLWLLWRDGICPEQMTFEGWNFDIVAGLLAPFAAWAAFGGGRRNKTIAIAYNVVGICLLTTIIVIAILSFPQVGVLTPENRLIAYWPMIWLPGFVAPFAMMLHLFSLRQVLRMR